jgi:MscS family membrane protein
MHPPALRRTVLWLLLCLLPVPTSLRSQSLTTAIKKATEKQPDNAQPANANAASGQAPAQTAVPAAPAPPPPTDALGRLSPHGCVLGFLRAAEAKDYEKAAQYLDGNTRRTPQQTHDLVIQLKYLLDLGFSNSIDDITRNPKGNLDDKLRLSRELVGTIRTKNGDLEVLLDLVDRPNSIPLWLFSQETLREVPRVYAGVQHKDFASYFPAWTAEVRFLSVPLWRWVFILVSFFVLLVSASLLTRGLLALIRLAVGRRPTPTIEEAVLALRGPFFGLLLAIMTHAAGGNALTALARHYWEQGALILVWICAGWLLIRLTDIVVSFAKRKLLMRMQVERITFVGLLARLFKILVCLILMIVLLSQAGVNVSALFAGLGIGGIALALAAQKTLADLFGGISVILRGAVRVGDFCTVAGRQGTVEEIGISSLRLRTLDRSVISIPNAKVAEMELENFALRDQFWLRQVFTLQFTTPPRTVKTVLDRIIQTLASEPDIDKQSARARLISLTSSGPQIEVFGYFSRPGADWAAFLATQEKIILKIMGIVESEGTSLAAPMGVVKMGTYPPENAVDSAGSDV